MSVKKVEKEERVCDVCEPGKEGVAVEICNNCGKDLCYCHYISVGIEYEISCVNDGEVDSDEYNAQLYLCEECGRVFLKQFTDLIKKKVEK